MNIKHDFVTAAKPALHHRAPICFLHCSGASRHQWQALAEQSAGPATTSLPQFSGPEVRHFHSQPDTFFLAEEAAPIIEHLSRARHSAHLVGHSYGGAVALHIAANHPKLVASLCLYEPTAFHLLNNSRAADAPHFKEIKALSRAIENAVTVGNHNFAAQIFTDFWGGLGAWQALSDTQRDAMLHYIPKAPLDFNALLHEPSAITDLANITVPVTIMRGTHTHIQTKPIAELIAATCARATLVNLRGANHLGPFIFKDRVNALVIDHIARGRGGIQPTPKRITDMTITAFSHPAPPILSLAGLSV